MTESLPMDGEHVVWNPTHRWYELQGRHLCKGDRLELLMPGGVWLPCMWLGVQNMAILTVELGQTPRFHVTDRPPWSVVDGRGHLYPEALGGDFSDPEGAQRHARHLEDRYNPAPLGELKIQRALNQVLLRWSLAEPEDEPPPGP